MSARVSDNSFPTITELQTDDTITINRAGTPYKILASAITGSGSTTSKQDIVEALEEALSNSTIVKQQLSNIIVNSDIIDYSQVVALKGKYIYSESFPFDAILCWMTSSATGTPVYCNGVSVTPYTYTTRYYDYVNSSTTYQSSTNKYLIPAGTELLMGAVGGSNTYTLNVIPYPYGTSNLTFTTFSLADFFTDSTRYGELTNYFSKIEVYGFDTNNKSNHILYTTTPAATLTHKWWSLHLTAKDNLFMNGGGDRAKSAFRDWYYSPIYNYTNATSVSWTWGTSSASYNGQTKFQKASCNCQIGFQSATKNSTTVVPKSYTEYTNIQLSIVTGITVS